MWIKLCGMTQTKDIIKARELGADAIGFIFAPSPRQITPEQAADISKNVDIPKVGVFVDPDLETLQKTVAACPLDYIQLHGNETPEFCKKIDVPVIKAFRIKDSSSLEQINAFNMVWKILLDAWVPGQAGGTGKRLDLDLLNNVDLDRTIIAGGINPDNIKDIISKIRPFGLDLSSGIEDAPGIKNHNKMQKLLNIIKENQEHA